MNLQMWNTRGDNTTKQNGNLNEHQNPENGN